VKRKIGVGIVVAIAALVGSFPRFVFHPMQMPSEGMRPTLSPGEHFFVRREWASGAPARGDVIAFVAPGWVPRNPGEMWVKRVLALGGQRVRRDDQTFIVDGKACALGEKHDDSYFAIDEEGKASTERTRVERRSESAGAVRYEVLGDDPPATADWPTRREPRTQQHGLDCTDNECTVQPGFVFVVGDNRDRSSDSRQWGGVPIENIVGIVDFVWYPTPHGVH
jgi:signal peptidase I